jgi:hypothetical protein
VKEWMEKIWKSAYCEEPLRIVSWKVGKASLYNVTIHSKPAKIGRKKDAIQRVQSKTGKVPLR